MDVVSEGSAGLQYLVFVGTLSWNKGPQFLMDAMCRVAAEFPQTCLALIGDGPLRTNLESQAERLRISGQVQFVGKIPHGQTTCWYQKAAVCVIPSLFETFSMVACEAMLHSLPIVASRRGALPELVVDGETGYLVEPTDSQAVAVAILRLLHNPDEARWMGRNGYDRAQQLYRMDTYLKNLADVVRFAKCQARK